jgi:3-methyladenine DNA glycosylase AlkD
MNADRLLEQLHNLENPENAVAAAKYHKVERLYLGVRVPMITQIAKKFRQNADESELVSTCEQLWATNIAEARVLVGKLLEVKQFKNIDAVWSLINRIKEDFDAWAIADHLEKGAKYCILANAARLDELERDWLPHHNFWIRRACLVYTLDYAKAGRNPERSLSWASRMVSDWEWFIQKAIGWWLRELSKHNPERVITFLELHRDKMKAFAVKEASKYL